MLTTGAALLVHGIIPGCFVKTGSRAIETLHRRMISNRLKHSAQPANSCDFVI
jgi:hypothetical protein